MAIKVFNYTNDAYIEAIDTRSEMGALVGNQGNAFFGMVVQVGSTSTYTVKADATIFVGGLCIRVLSDETFDLTSNKYIAVETTYNPVTDGYTCALKALNTLNTTLVGTVSKHVAIFQKGLGAQNKAQGVADLFAKSNRSTCLFDGATYMDDGQRINFSNVQDANYQTMYLTFSHYTIGTGADNWGWITYSIPVGFIAKHEGQGHTIQMAVEGTVKSMYKYLYVGLTAVSGNAQNVQVVDGVNFRTKCLREVWAVG
ncbi:hypothetical protein HCA00_04625 [Listeria booriae]|uniref:Uncharacterized protein n=1 Tax=Listeria booriae TaxID=1552123 RepID=A0A842FZ02_9LIST|nr:hypothetical protein [Listeria booriae]MBC2285750.1 hypothetical protein [Listeria booriae]MBC6128067.1 hypothetical protein [Listeria booriae]